MELGCRGRNYLIVGGTRGMGYAAAAALAEDGAHVAIVGRDAEQSRQAADELAQTSGTRVVGLAGDMTMAGDADRVVTEAADVLGPLRGVATTTGLGGRGQRSLPDATDDDWTATFDDILLSTVRICRAALPHLVAAGGGSIVTTAAYSVHSPKLRQVAYASLKSGVATLTKAIAKSYGEHGVRANCVCPGAVETDVLAGMRHLVAEQRGWPVESALERVMAEEWGMSVALGRPGTAAEVGDTIAFLLSERCGYTTGALINIDGGTDF